MEKKQSYEQLIIEGIKGLPQELLAEIADFVYVVRKRFTQPRTFEAELETILLDQTSTNKLSSEAPVMGEEPNGDWLSLAGTISHDDLQLMAEAIEAGCEKVDLDEW